MALLRVSFLQVSKRRLLQCGTCWKPGSKLSVHTSPQMPPCDFTPEKYESQPYNHILKIRKQNFSPFMATYFQKPLLLHQGYMQWLFDYEGRRYLDLFSGIVTVSVGHCHPKVTTAAQKQLGRLWHTSPAFLHPAIHEYAEKLTALFPEPLKVVFFANSGSEANDIAMLMARSCSQNVDIISFRGAYHGSSPYTIGLTNVGTFKPKTASGSSCQATMCPDVFRGPWGGSQCRDSLVQTIRKCDCTPGCCKANSQYIEEFKNTLHTVVAKEIAGFFAEPIQGVNGVVQYPKGFLKEAFQLVRERGGVCISDEVQTGLGRLGTHFWGFQSHGVLPDIVTMAKGIGNGFPMSAVVTTPEIAKSFTKLVNHFNTFAGNPMAGVIGSAVLDAIKEDGLQENSQETGSYMLLKLAKLRDEFEIVGDVRGKGLMIGIEMVQDQDSRQPLPLKEMNLIHEDCKDMGLILGRGGLFSQTFRIAPPMCITKQEADFAVEVLHSVLSRHMEKRAKGKL
ncbi:alanine--glyoxylate aminotransferase 2, mitochondrial isoform X1 [Trichosurus vulpecula]|uniref:alanine--glyoxylate aminotransferase 2, mitochondrial isoform X1 n=1 Tax=Trichosurus vulpecula TaxID=9337 RepID=UPI00186AEFC1|nr:alanine--glyoxylate aminotransferase 2, mitochondrial isoform X1 [Trichosurus vulpecula]